VPNQYQPWQIFTNEAMRILKNKTVFLKGCNRDNEHLFGKTGMKAGQTVNVSLPARYVGRTGEGYQPEGYNATSVPVTVQPLAGVDVDLPSTDITLYLDDIKKKVLAPAMAQLVNNIERACLQIAYQGVANYVGTVGSGVATATVPLQANAYITNEGGPDDDTRRMLITPNTNVSLVPALSGLFNPSTKIGKQYERGVLAKETLGFDWYQTQNLWQHTIGTLGGTPVINGSNQSGNSLVTNGWTAAAGLRLKKGDIIQIAGVNAVNPMTRQTYGSLRNFVVTADVYSDGAGNATIPISPSIVAAPAQFATTDTVPASGALISVYNTAAAGQGALSGATYANCLGYHSNAFTFAGLRQELPTGSTDIAYQATDPETGVQLRFVRQFQGKDNVFINRFDVLFAFGVVYPQLACRMVSL
jgi:hypothetical protein